MGGQAAEHDNSGEEVRKGMCSANRPRTRADPAGAYRSDMPRIRSFRLFERVPRSASRRDDLPGKAEVRCDTPVIRWSALNRFSLSLSKSPKIKQRLAFGTTNLFISLATFLGCHRRRATCKPPGSSVSVNARRCTATRNLSVTNVRRTAQFPAERERPGNLMILLWLSTRCSTTRKSARRTSPHGRATWPSEISFRSTLEEVALSFSGRAQAST